jgi:hypothetical protein
MQPDFDLPRMLCGLAGLTNKAMSGRISFATDHLECSSKSPVPLC